MNFFILMKGSHACESVWLKPQKGRRGDGFNRTAYEYVNLKKKRLDYEDMEYTMNIILRDWFLDHVEEKKNEIVLTISHFLLFSFD